MNPLVPGKGCANMRSRFLLCGILVSSFHSAWAACPAPVPLAKLGTDVDGAERSYANLDLDGFMAASNTLRADLACVSDPMTKAVAARVHRVEGLRGFVDQNKPASTQAFAAARADEPDYVFPESLIPAGNPELEYYTAIDLSIGTTQKVDPMIDGYILFDGKIGVDRPTLWPAIVQVINGDGDIIRTAYVHPGEPMPSYQAEAQQKAAAQARTPNADTFKDPDEDEPDDTDLVGVGSKPPPTSHAPTTSHAPSTSTTTTHPPTTTTHPNYAPSTSTTTHSTPMPSTTTRTAGHYGDDSTTIHEEKPKKHPVGLLAVSLASFAASGVSYGIALHAANTWREPTTSYDQLDALRVQANVWSGVAGGAGLLALGTIIGVGVAW